MERRSASEPESSNPSCRHDQGKEPVCSRCGSLREPPEGADHFVLLGLPRGLTLDEEKLRDRFYELSRLVHPDRYAGGSPRDAMLATRWTTAVNRAYQTLRDPERRARYLLEIFGRADAERKDAIPMELAETWFEIQDLLGDEKGAASVASFRQDLERQLGETTAEWVRIGALWTKDEPAALAALGRLLVKRKYLASMLADIGRKTGGK